MNVSIVGGGISGLATAYYLLCKYPEWSVTVFEKETVLGGKIGSVVQDGFVFDTAANGFLTNVDETLELARALGLEPQPASEHAKHRFLFKNGQLNKLPASPPAFLSSNLLTPWGKLRAASEFWSGRAAPHEESVYEFIYRHFGREVAEVLAGPAVLGITAGDAKRLSLDALFPRFRTLEQEKGSLLRALIATQKKNKGKSGRLHSFKGGMQTLIDALEKALQGHVRKGVSVTRVSPLSERGYGLMLSDGQTLIADQVILATPAFISSQLLESFLPQASRYLKEIHYADVSVFGLGYHRLDVPHTLEGFGFLVPRGEAVRSLGVLWSNAIFPDQAPKDHVMLRVICGGTLDPDFIKLSSQEAWQVVQHDLRLSMGITTEPVLRQQASWPQGIPQYVMGHAQKVTAIMETLKASRGLYLTGNAFYGVGVNDCVRDARRVVQEMFSDKGQ